MPADTEDREFVSYVVDLMQSVGPVNAKRMFGGHGIYLDGLMFALISERTLFLKADKESESDFKARGLEMFTYSKKGKKVSMSYFQTPEETLEDPGEMNVWARRAYEAALRAAAKKRRK